jgi:hypothetical protein
LGSTSMRLRMRSLRARKHQHWRAPLASTAGNSEQEPETAAFGYLARALLRTAGPAVRNLWLSATCAVWLTASDGLLLAKS